MTSGIAMRTHVERQPHNQIALEREHHQDSEEQCDQRERADPWDESRTVPFLAFDAYEHKARDEPGDERNAKIDSNALCDLPDADIHDTSFKAKPLGKHCNEDPRIEAVKEYLKDTVDGDESGDIVRVPIRQFIPYQNHRNTASDSNQDEAAHVGRFAPQKHDGKDEHERRTNQPVLDQ